MSTEDGVVSKRTMEIAVALILAGLGAIVIFDNYRLGASWGADGPQAGYFPFYIGIMLTASSLIVLGQVVVAKGDDGPFVDRVAFRQVMEVLVPAVVFAVAVVFIGIYVAGAVLIAFFMIWFGRFRWHYAVAVPVAVQVFFFMMFEVWFNVPLPKGPLEAAFGF